MVRQKTVSVVYDRAIQVFLLQTSYAHPINCNCFDVLDAGH